MANPQEIQNIIMEVLGANPNEMTPKYRSNGNPMKTVGEAGGKLPMPAYDEAEQERLYPKQGGSKGYHSMIPGDETREKLLQQVTGEAAAPSGGISVEDLMMTYEEKFGEPWTGEADANAIFAALMGG